MYYPLIEDDIPGRVADKRQDQKGKKVTLAEAFDRYYRVG